MRFWEVDSLRGLAIIGMVVYHFLWDLNFFGYSVGVSSILQKIVAGTFILLVGVSLTLSYSRKPKKWDYYVKRGLMIFAWGVVITVVTKLVLGQSYVRFGILHLIGLSVALGYFFLKFRRLNVLFGSLCFIVYYFIKDISSSLWYWVGFNPTFGSVDYFPLFPWFGVVLFGMFLGNTLYFGYKRQFEIVTLRVKWLEYLGKHSLIIYIIHQPILFGLMYVFSHFYS
jgi:uncharacterized membrane protein